MSQHGCFLACSLLTESETADCLFASVAGEESVVPFDEVSQISFPQKSKK
jgi:hypothetical protein